MKLVIEGPPGAGKGTIAQIICEQLNIPHISTGDILRHHIAENDELGKLAAPYLEKGQFIPNHITIDIMKNRLEQDDAKDTFLLDGFPRNEEQTNWLLDFSEISGLIFVKIEDDLIVKRLSKRRVCPECGETYHLENNPPKKEGICDIDGAQLIHRSDDEPETIKKRLELYHKEIDTVLDLFKKKNIPFLELRGDFDIKNEAKAMVKQVKEWQNG